MSRTALILSILSLVGCQQLPKYPDHFIYDVDLDNKVCGEYKLNKKKKTLTWVRDLPLSECNGNLSVKYADALRIKGWVIDVEKKWNEVCK